MTCIYMWAYMYSTYLQLGWRYWRTVQIQKMTVEGRFQYWHVTAAGNAHSACNTSCILPAHMKKLMVGPDKPSIPGQHLFKASYELSPARNTCACTALVPPPPQVQTSFYTTACTCIYERELKWRHSVHKQDIRYDWQCWPYNYSNRTPHSATHLISLSGLRFFRGPSRPPTPADMYAT